jgi:hypothetical protein
VTNGGPSGTGGAFRLDPLRLGPFRIGPIAWIAAFAVVIALVNATSRIMEAGRRGEALAAWEPLCWEFTSVAVIIALAPAVREAVQRVKIGQRNLAPALVGHAALTIPFSLVHLPAMVGLRKLAYWLAGSAYDFSHGQLALEFIYEWRKDAVTYGLLAGFFWVLQWRADEAAARTPASPERIEIRDGATAIYLQPADIAWVEAAGNYVEFHTSAGDRLVRGTLQAWEAKLAPLGFVRAHRSRIVNRARIRAIRPKPSGDLEIELDDGRAVAGARR